MKNLYLKDSDHIKQIKFNRLKIHNSTQFKSSLVNVIDHRNYKN